MNFGAIDEMTKNICLMCPKHVFNNKSNTNVDEYAYTIHSVYGTLLLTPSNKMLPSLNMREFTNSTIRRTVDINFRKFTISQVSEMNINENQRQSFFPSHKSSTPTRCGARQQNFATFYKVSILVDGLQFHLKFVA